MEVSGYAPVVEAAGTCRVKLSGPDGATAEAEVAATADVSTTTCGVVSIPRSSLSAGRWIGTLTYDSPTSHGEAELSPIEVP